MNYKGTDTIEAELRDRLAALKAENSRLLARLEKLEAVAAAAKDCCPCCLPTAIAMALAALGDDE